jgi:hypothetical protein
MASSTRLTLVRGSAGTLLWLALIALVTTGATVSHVHASAAPAFFNEEHDLTAFATVGSSAGLLSEAPRLAPLVVAFVLGVRRPDVALPAAPRRAADPRAPPVR